MSMLSEQCARLRSWAAQFDDRADLDALAPLLARDLREAADTIISLRDRLQAAELGSGTCEIVAQTWEDRGGDEEDTYKYELSCGHAVRMLDCEPLHNCPRCGKAVKR